MVKCCVDDGGNGAAAAAPSSSPSSSPSFVSERQGRFALLRPTKRAADGAPAPQAADAPAPELFQALSGQRSPSTQRNNAADIASVASRLNMFRPIVTAVANQEIDHLTAAEIDDVRAHLAAEYDVKEALEEAPAGGDANNSMTDGSARSMLVASFRDLLHCDVASSVATDRSDYAYLRQLIRAASRYGIEILPQTLGSVRGNGHEYTPRADKVTARDFFVMNGRPQRPPRKCNLIKRSHIVCSQGVNGGHYETSITTEACEASLPDWMRDLWHATDLYRSVDKLPYGKPAGNDKGDDKVSPAVSKILGARTQHISEWLLQGSDINANVLIAAARDNEISGFLSECILLNVGLVWANGFTHSYNMTNVKSLTCITGQYMNHESNFDVKDKANPAYLKGCPRDFFGFFGDAKADDGVVWKKVGPRTREAHIGDMRIISRKVDSARNVVGCKSTLYELDIRYRHLNCCLGPFMQRVEKRYKLFVFHTKTYDQGPAMLSYGQTSLLMHALTSVPAKHPRVLIHCAGGVGRTGNCAFAISEVLARGFASLPPTRIIEKLLMMRADRPGLIQSPEQLVDAAVLSAMVLTVLLDMILFDPEDLQPLRRRAAKATPVQEIAARMEAIDARLKELGMQGMR